MYSVVYYSLLSISLTTFKGIYWFFIQNFEFVLNIKNGWNLIKNLPNFILVLEIIDVILIFNPFYASEMNETRNEKILETNPFTSGKIF